MIKALLFDFSKTILFPKDRNYQGSLNSLHKEMLLREGYNFLDHFELDENLLSYLKGVKSKYKLYIFTSGSVQNAPEIKPRLDEIFDKIFSAEEIGLAKNDPKAYEYIAKAIGLTPDEVLFTDDTEENIKVAKSIGMNTTLYKELEELRKKISEVLSRN